jgi:hypothetical protein
VLLDVGVGVATIVVDGVGVILAVGVVVGVCVCVGVCVGVLLVVGVGVIYKVWYTTHPAESTIFITKSLDEYEFGTSKVYGALAIVATYTQLPLKLSQ